MNSLCIACRSSSALGYCKKYTYTPVEDNWRSRTFSLMPHGFPFQITPLHLDFPLYILATDLDFQYKLSMASENFGFPVNFVIFEVQMWISRTYDKFHPGFPVKTSLPGLDVPVNLQKYSVDFQYHSLSKNMSSKGGYGYFLH